MMSLLWTLGCLLYVSLDVFRKKRTQPNSVPLLLDEEVVFTESELLEDGSNEIIATCVPNGAENVVAPDFVQQLKDTLLASQHHDSSLSGSQSKIASFPAAV